jgi:hypothetical protein
VTVANPFTVQEILLRHGIQSSIIAVNAGFTGKYFQVVVGDETSGKYASRQFDYMDVNDIGEFMSEEACSLFPDSEFSKIYRKFQRIFHTNDPFSPWLRESNLRKQA